MGLRLMVGRGASPGKGLGKYLQGKVEAPMLKGKFDYFGLGYKPDMKQMRKEVEKRQERRRARLSGEEVKGIYLPLARGSRSEGIEEMLEKVCINAIEAAERRSLLKIGPYEPGNLLRMVEQEDKQILPHKESLEIVSLEEGKEVKIETDIAARTKYDLIELLREFKDVFAWSYQDMPGLNTSIVVHRLPIKEDCKPVQQKFRRMRPDVVLKIKEEVKKQFDTGFLQEVKYSEWVANIIPVPKEDGKVGMCVDYRDLNKASSKDNFPLPYIDTLVDNTAGHSLFSFMDGFSRYNQIKMHPEDMSKTTFITLWGTFRYKVMPFGLRNAGATTEEDHLRVLRKLFLRLRKFQLKLNPAKCIFGARSGKLLGFIVSKKEIEIDPDKVKAIRDLPPSNTQKEVRGFLGRLNYIAQFISQLTEKCDPVFRLLKKHNLGEWDEGCQKAFDKIKQYLTNAPILSLPSPDRPLILYLTVFNNSMGCVLGQHDETGKKERAIYYLIYVSQKAIKGSAIADFLASRALEDYEPLNFDFPNEELLYVANTEENPRIDHIWKLNFDGASNATEYEACIMGIHAAIQRNIKVLRVYGDSALVIYQLKGEWETRDPKLISYRRLVLELVDEFDDITFSDLLREENQMADVLATLASMI
ncbi:uncharacterized protein LOC105767226 [Gossypium raimondii]|uniref:uncharacterized protein LOC105767226 n=1 Tax=Gossypium raimondii TaxID=29730 RepID=UPI00063ACB8C|nr:uncharacterized protein LOC105767226 [Gossypium raimondii]